MLHLREERMADHFVKHHVEGLPAAAVFHQFNQADYGDPHDHPWPFTSFVISGGYMEQVFQLDGSSEMILREPGQSFQIAANHIHRIVDLPLGQCTTIILPGLHERKSGFYQFRDRRAWHRYWDQTVFQPLAG
ncbi:cupin domain-containing protein [Devosia aurantiaca]|uniref:Cupin domain-containing protein n=1 Tax=Devosia aurantiaca TaxID=2714858 RepID=A0A6M1SQ91_9HYPH|nr:hypothetical protein [Devosia aurantiaca]NGP19310.1 hypothetical protein [Devosia aurantiaca]